jgi:peptide/nickel transport system substrate-binding protein
VEFNSLVTRLSNTYQWEAVLIGFTGGVEPYNSRTLWASSGALHLWNPKQQKPTTPWEAEIDGIFNEVGRTADEAKRKQLWGRFQEIAAEQQPLVFLATPNSLQAYRNRLVNVKPTSLAGMRWNLYEISAQ